MSHRKELAGIKFNFLTVVSYVGKAKWLCRCDCGNIVNVRGPDLKKEAGTKSCGCLRAAKIGDRQRKHGLSRHRLSMTWSKMKSRCFNRKSQNYKYYGGRGITVCARWLKLENFIADMADSYPGEGFTLDRIDNSGNYEPNNCRWATKSEQVRNSRPRGSCSQITNKSA